MYRETSKIQPTIAAKAEVVACIFFVAFVPSHAMWTLKHALESVMARLIPFDTDFYTAGPILGATFGIWMLLLGFGGTLLVIVARSIYNGNLNARATGLGVAGIASAAGMIMFIPWMVLIVSEYSQVLVSGISPPPADTTMVPQVLWTMVVGLVAFFIFLLMDKDSIKDKIFKTIIITGIGVVAGMVFMNAQHGVRYFAFIPEYQTETSFLKPLGNVYTNLDHYDAIGLTTVSQIQIDNLVGDQAIDIVRKEVNPATGKHLIESVELKNTEAVYNPNTLALLLGGYGNYLASYLMVFLIPFVFLRKKWAYNALLMATLFLAIAAFQIYFVRGSFEWAIVGLMSLGLFVFQPFPIFKKYLVEPEKPNV